jgi:hypothetical protein
MNWYPPKSGLVSVSMWVNYNSQVFARCAMCKSLLTGRCTSMKCYICRTTYKPVDSHLPNYFQSKLKVSVTQQEIYKILDQKEPSSWLSEYSYVDLKIRKLCFIRTYRVPFYLDKVIARTKDLDNLYQRLFGALIGPVNVLCQFNR